MTILEKIIEHKKDEVAFAKKQKPKKQFEDEELFYRKTYSLVQHLKDKTGIIAEFKRKSPSRQNINNHSGVEEVTNAYAENGASGISVLTDGHFFGGSLEDLFLARKVSVPLLRKDFMIDEYQFYEAKANGADVILLIASYLSPTQANEFTHLAKEIGLEVLLEIHTEDELKHIGPLTDMVGINNRNLKDFKVDIQHSIDLKNKLPYNKPAIAESGIYDVGTFLQLRTEGFDGFLMGEYFMKEQNPGEAFKLFSQKIQNT